LADEEIKRVKEANDIVDVVGGYVALRPAGATYKGLCPFHDDHRPSFDVDPRRQRYRCWSCGKYGDVFTFVQEHDRIPFGEALELLAKRAGIVLDQPDDPHARTRVQLLDVVRWATQLYHQCLLDEVVAEDARRYLGGRGLVGEIVRRYELGFAPRSGEWLVHKAESANISTELLEQVGLIAPRQERGGWYDRFRDRVLFPIRNTRGQPIAFGGRILPGSPLASRGPKYYNSSDTPLFTKSEHLYGLDQARHAADKAGYLAVVEGYTDVLMAHQMGILPVVATMGTALNSRHVRQLRRFAPRVVLVFDADAGGATGVDRALEIFASQDIDLRVATLPEGLDPCDLLVQQGPEPFRKSLESAVDALETKLQRVLGDRSRLSVEEARQAVDAVLGIIALAPPAAGHAATVKAQLMIGRVARRLALKEETVWARLEELRKHKRGDARATAPSGRDEAPAPRMARAAPEESQLLQVLLAEPALVSTARAAISAAAIHHPGLRELLAGLYCLLEAGEPPTLDQLRPRLDNVALAEKALELQDIGRASPDRRTWLARLLAHFQERKARRELQELQTQLQAASDHAQALELLRQLQNRQKDQSAGTPPTGAGLRGEGRS
jgi:DNA primase